MPVFLSNHKQFSGIKIDFLPIASLEKYLRRNLYLNIDKNLFSLLDTYLFQKKPLNEIIALYDREDHRDDSDGKAFYGCLLNEIRSMRKDREDLVDLVVKYIFENDENGIERVAEYLRNKIK